MVDLDTRLHELGNRPPARPSPVADLRRRATRRQRRRQAAVAAVVTVALVSGIAVIIARDRDGALDTLGPGQTRPQPVAPGTSTPREMVLGLAKLADQRPPLTSADTPILHIRKNTTELLSTATVPAENFAQNSDADFWELTNGRTRGKYTAALNRRINADGSLGAEDNSISLPYAKDVVFERGTELPEAAPAGGLAETRSKVGNTVPDTRGAREAAATEAVIYGIEHAVSDPKIQAGWLRSLAEIPGLEVVPNATDRWGRTGLGVKLPGPKVGWQTDAMLIFDPQTGALLSKQVTALAGTYAASGVTGSFVLSEATYATDAVSDAPAAQLQMDAANNWPNGS